MSERTGDFHSAGGGTPTWWAAGVFLFVVLIALFAVLVLGGDPTEPSAQTSSPSTAASATAAPPSPVREGRCQLPDDDQDVPVAGPPASWVSYGYAFVPQSTVYGPVVSEGRTWGCFAHSPTGALFAAANLFAELGEPDYEQVAAEALVDNPAAATWLAQQDPDSRQQSPGKVAQFAGFEFQSVSDDEVVVAVALQDGTVAGAVKIALVWDEGAGTWLGDVAASTLTPFAIDLNTYTPWSAVDG